MSPHIITSENTIPGLGKVTLRFLTFMRNPSSETSANSMLLEPSQPDLRKPILTDNDNSFPWKVWISLSLPCPSSCDFLVPGGSHGGEIPQSCSRIENSCVLHTRPYSSKVWERSNASLSIRAAVIRLFLASKNGVRSKQVLRWLAPNGNVFRYAVSRNDQSAADFHSEKVRLVFHQTRKMIFFAEEAIELAVFESFCTSSQS